MSAPTWRHLNPKELLRRIERSDAAQKILVCAVKGTTQRNVMFRFGFDENSIWYWTHLFENHDIVKISPVKVKGKPFYVLTENGHYYLEKIRPAVWHLLER